MSSDVYADLDKRVSNVDQGILPTSPLRPAWDAWKAAYDGWKVGLAGGERSPEEFAAWDSALKAWETALATGSTVPPIPVTPPEQAWPPPGPPVTPRVPGTSEKSKDDGTTKMLMLGAGALLALYLLKKK